ncbi:unnamed protein product [Prunus armeniaca]
MILDAVLVANEVVQEAVKRNKVGSVFKIDFDHAYDRVEWRMVDEVLERKGFGGRWRSWIRGCLHSVNFSVMINGRPRGKFSATRGVRQGDPLSPFVFTLVIDVLSRLMEKAQECNLIHGMFTGRDNVEVSHLQFADDTIFLIGDKEEYWFNLLDLLDFFCLISGMKINKSKCSLVGFGHSPSFLNRLASGWGCAVGDWPMMYLGLPLGGNPRSIGFWDPVFEKVQRRLQKWKRAFLSRGGRLTLIQAVLSSIPTYYMSLFKMPVSVINKLEKLMRSFLWEGVEVGKRDHLVKWERVANSKEEGGLGVGSLREKNEALRAKWLWRLPKEPNSLWARVVKSKYGFEVGNGNRVRFWEDSWVKEGLLKDSFPRLFALSSKQSLSIDRFVDSHVFPHNWDFGFRRNLNDRETAEAIKLLEVLDGFRLCASKRDRRRWDLEVSGFFTCKSFQSFLRNKGSVVTFLPFSSVWKAKSPPKVKVFVWLVALGKVNTLDLVQRKRPFMYLSPQWCVLCKLGEESVDHLFLHCPFSLSLWGLLWREVGTVWVIPKGCADFLCSDFEVWGSGKRASTLWGCLVHSVFWNIWMERNRRIFEDYKGVGVSDLWDRVKYWAALWASVTEDFKDYSVSTILRDMAAVVM